MKAYSIGIVAVLVWSASVEGREWKDVSGKYQTEAELVEYRVREASVVLKKANGKTIVVPFDKLSTADREYVMELAAIRQTNKAQPRPRTFVAAAVLSRILQPADEAPEAQLELPADERQTPADHAPAAEAPPVEQGMEAEKPAHAAPPVNPLPAMAEQVPPPPSPDQLADQSGMFRLQGRDRRFVYRGCCGQFHLVPDKQGMNGGTALYWWPPHRRGIHLMDSLIEDTSATYPLYLVYLAAPGAPAQRWAFSRQKWINGCHHVWYQRPDGVWRFYEYASREKVF